MMISPAAGRGAWLVVVLALAALACSLGTDGGDTVEDLAAQPLVLVLAPVNGSVIAEGAQVALHALAQEARAGVARIEFSVDDFAVGEIFAENQAGEPSLKGVVVWTAAERRGHLITAEAFRPDGSSVGLNDVTVQVVEPPAGRVPLATAPSQPLTEETSAPPAEPTPSAQPSPTSGVPAIVIPEGSPVARANVASLNLRQGPGTGYPPVGTLAQGDAVPIVGRSDDGSWWAVAYGSGTAWVFTALTTVEGDTSSVPLVAAP